MRAYGRLPGWQVTAASFVSGGLSSELLRGTADAVVGWILFTAFVVYCVARPSGGLTVFLYSCLPGAAAVIASLSVDVEGWAVAAPAMVVALLLIADMDRRARQDPSAERRGAAGRAYHREA